MKRKNIINHASHLALAAALAVLAGCASGNYQKGADTSAGLNESAEKVTVGKDKIDATLAALNDLVNNPQGDLVPKFKKFSTAMTDLESTAKHISGSVGKMRASGNEYLKKWDEQLAQVKNEDIKTRSAERKAEVQTKLMDIKRSYAEAEMAFKPFMADLKDIQSVLATDLTVGGVSTVKGATDKANKDATPLKASIGLLATQFKDLGVAMASAAPAAAPAQSAEAPK